MQTLKTIDAYIAKFEKLLVVVMIFSIVGVNVLQIFLRFLEVKMPSYATSINQVIVLWLAMVGGSLATQKAEHIKVDFLSRYLRGRQRSYIMIAINLFAVIIGGILTWYAIGFIRMEYEMKETFTAIPIRLWILQLIMPISLSIIVYRFFLLLIEEISNLWLPIGIEYRAEDIKGKS